MYIHIKNIRYSSEYRPEIYLAIFNRRGKAIINKTPLICMANTPNTK